MRAKGVIIVTLFMQVDNYNKKQKYVSLRDILYFAQNYILQWSFFGVLFF